MPRLNGIPVSPRARRFLASRKIDLRRVRGSGPGGRIVEGDIPQDSAHGAFTSSSPGNQSVSAMRRAIAESTTRSFAVPHFNLRAEIDATQLIAFREARLLWTEKRENIRVTLTDIFLKALGRVLREFPAANSIWQDDSIQLLGEINVGLVISVERGLFLPVIRDVDQLSLEQIAAVRGDLVKAARAGQLKPRDFSRAAVSLSNLGRSRVDEFSAVLAPNQTFMLALGRIAPRPFVVDDVLLVRKTAKLCLSVDHRVMDGEPAAKFLSAVIEFLESPATVL